MKFIDSLTNFQSNNWHFYGYISSPKHLSTRPFTRGWYSVCPESTFCMKEDNPSLRAFRNPLAWIRHSRTALSRDEIQWLSCPFQRANQYPFNPVGRLVLVCWGGRYNPSAGKSITVQSFVKSCSCVLRYGCSIFYKIVFLSDYVKILSRVFSVNKK